MPTKGYPRTRFEIVDKTNVQEISTNTITYPKPLAMQLITADKGPENWTVVRDLDDFADKYGAISFAKHGQPHLNVAEILRAGGAVLIKRLVHPDSGIGNVTFCVKITKTIKRETITAEENNENTFEDTVSYSIEYKTISLNSKSEKPAIGTFYKTHDDVIKGIESIYENSIHASSVNNFDSESITESTTGTTDKYNNAIKYYSKSSLVPLFTITTVDRDCGKMYCKLVPIYNNDIMLYNFSLYERTDNEDKLVGSTNNINISLDENIQINNIPYDIESKVNANMPLIKVKAYNKNMSEFVNILKSALNDESVSVNNIDIINLTNVKGESINLNSAISLSNSVKDINNNIILNIDCDDVASLVFNSDKYATLAIEALGMQKSSVIINKANITSGTSKSGMGNITFYVKVTKTLVGTKKDNGSGANPRYTFEYEETKYKFEHETKVLTKANSYSKNNTPKHIYETHDSVVNDIKLFYDGTIHTGSVVNFKSDGIIYNDEGNLLNPDKPTELLPASKITITELDNGKIGYSKTTTIPIFTITTSVDNKEYGEIICKLVPSFGGNTIKYDLSVYIRKNSQSDERLISSINTDITHIESDVLNNIPIIKIKVYNDISKNTSLINDYILMLQDAINNSVSINNTEIIGLYKSNGDDYTLESGAKDIDISDVIRNKNGTELNLGYETIVTDEIVTKEKQTTITIGDNAKSYLYIEPKSNFDAVIYDTDRYKIDFVCDAGYDVRIKKAIAYLADFRQDFAFLCDLKNIRLTDSVDSEYCNLNSVYSGGIFDAAKNIPESKFVAIYHNTADVYDPYTKKQINITLPYLLGPKMVDHINSGVGKPFAGILNNIIFPEIIDGSINFIPRVFHKIDQKASFIEKNINYLAYYDSLPVMDTMYVNMPTYTQLSYLSNIMNVQTIIKELRTKCPKTRYSFIDGTDLQKYLDDTIAIINNYNSFFKSINIKYMADSEYENNNIFYAVLTVQFRNFVQEEYFRIFLIF